MCSLLLEVSKVHSLREQGKHCATFNDLALKVTWVLFLCILLVEALTSYSGLPRFEGAYMDSPTRSLGKSLEECGGTETVLWPILENAVYLGEKVTLVVCPRATGEEVKTDQ